MSLYLESPRTKKRNAAERRFQSYGLAAIAAALFFLVVLLGQIIGNGSGAFIQTRLTVPVTLDAAAIEKAEGSMMKTSGYRKLIVASLSAEMQAKGIEAELDSKAAKALLSSGAPNTLRQHVLANPADIGSTVTLKLAGSSRLDGYMKGRVTRESISDDKAITPAHLDLADELIGVGLLSKGFNWGFVTGNDASDLRPEQSGMGQSVLGSLAMMLVVLAVCLPISVAASIYLEEFAPKNKLTQFIEVNISNLAAVPSIVFGILALAAFIQFGGGTIGIEAFRASAPLVGGLALSLMTLPTIIIATRAALKAVPQSMRDAALGVGASKMQAVFHHVLPLAMPGIMTGTIIGLAAALGETAPLLLIGMVAFVQTDISGATSFFTDPNVGMPAQIYIWATRADGAWYERAWGGIILLLIFLACMNIVAILLRRKFERRW
ncbi:phosphate ABC transporter permease PstA [Lentibacter algarum]|uniref:phosphate ABC transporter permease PstA n=1 Tax=Lentibacter algarum TaxID=576131 RepID=UPI001C069BBA|nr:phosphate ABC transporter permease PstA [Lentibacter algarum]MBU2982356.1 phosphate ABC transporter permease PstA [Lentibacter algarum]